MPVEDISNEAKENAPAAVGADAGDRVPAVVVTGFELLTETAIGAPWEYNRRVYEIWGIYAHWPAGFLLHMAGPSSDGVMIQSVWRTSEQESTYMAEVGIERYTEVTRVLSEEGSEHPVDLLPVNNKLERLTFGPLAKHFVDIGPDLDESAGKQFGTVLTAVDIRLPGISTDQQERLWTELRLANEAHPDLIVRIQVTDDTETRDTHLWVSERAAREFVESQLTPLLAQIAEPEAAAPVVEFRPIRRLAIGSSELDRGLFDGAAAD
ncbi:MAG: hypothetical protein ACPHCI_07355 [Solirubrobacterales bacterium]